MKNSQKKMKSFLFKAVKNADSYLYSRQSNTFAAILHSKQDKCEKVYNFLFSFVSIALQHDGVWCSPRRDIYIGNNLWTFYFYSRFTFLTKVHSQTIDNKPHNCLTTSIITYSYSIDEMNVVQSAAQEPMCSAQNWPNILGGVLQATSFVLLKFDVFILFVCVLFKLCCVFFQSAWPGAIHLRCSFLWFICCHFFLIPLVCFMFFFILLP